MVYKPIRGILSTRLIAYLELLAAVVIWGASFVATKIVLRELPPLMMVWTRFLMGSIVLGVVVIQRGQFFIPKLSSFLYLGLVGFVGITFHQWLQSTALQTTEASTSSWIVATSPIFMALLGWLFLRERLDFTIITGIIAATIGMILVVSKGEVRQVLSGKIGSLGDLMMLISALNWAVFSTLSKWGLRDHPPTFMMFLVMVWGWSLTTIMLLLSNSWHPLGQLSSSGWVGLIFLGVFCSGLAYLFWYDGLQVVPVVQVGAFLYIEPLVTLFIAAILLNERITWASIMGGGMIILGVWLVNRRAFAPENKPRMVRHELTRTNAEKI